MKLGPKLRIVVGAAVVAALAACSARGKAVAPTVVTTVAPVGTTSPGGPIGTRPATPVATHYVPPGFPMLATTGANAAVSCQAWTMATSDKVDSSESCVVHTHMTTVTGSNVRIYGDKITMAPGDTRGLLAADGITGLDVEFSTITAGPGRHQVNAVDIKGATRTVLNQVQIHGGEHSIEIGNSATVEASYVDNVDFIAGCHCDNIQVLGRPVGVSSAVIIKDNTLIDSDPKNPDTQLNSPIIWGNQTVSAADEQVTGNYVDGRAQAGIVCPGASSTKVTIQDNRFGSGLAKGVDGATCFDHPGVTFDGTNRWIGCGTSVISSKRDPC